MIQPEFNISPQHLEDFCRRYQIRRLALFGSVLRADFRPDSDIDVLVLFDENAQVGFLMLGRMQRELSQLFHRPIDLVPQDGLKPAIRDEVLNSAVEVYAVR